ncbi:MAG: hypothetical protein COA85_04495 [Robiginitomaculum sp.]|nr:MAG: hypothetical protein COA85_04495 [Robiginitomaculum sp.]
MAPNLLFVMEQSFTPADLVLISAISLVCAGAMRNYGNIIVTVFIATAVDYMLPGVFALLTGAPVGDALAASWTRLAGYSSVALLVRTLFYFAAISLLFGTKAAYGRR